MRPCPGGPGFEASLERALGTHKEVPATVFKAEYALRFNRFGGWGPFIQVYLGQDYYNLTFAGKVKRLHFGLCLSQERFDMFGSSD